MPIRTHQEVTAVPQTMEYYAAVNGERVLSVLMWKLLPDMI